MARSARSSAIKANNKRRAARINGPVETAREERLSAKLLELAKQPKPETSDLTMDVQDDGANAVDEVDEAAMDVDSGKGSKSRTSNNRIQKRTKPKKHGHVFTKYTERRANLRKKKESK